MSRTTMEDVAREAGVSRALVSLAYRNAFGVSDATRQHILATGERLGYVPNRVAAHLATRQSSSIGVFLQDLHNDLFAGLYDGIREVAEEHGRELVLVVGSRKEDRDAASLRTLQGTRVAAIVAAGLRLPDAEALAHSARTPLVAVARRIPGVDSVYSDNLVGGRLATEHLLGLGHRSIVFLANPPADGYRDRGLGYEQAMASAGLAPRTIVTSYAREEAAADAARLFDAADPPTAVFAHNDQAALGVLDTLASRGLRPGVDMSVVGYDNSSISSAPGTALTTIDLHGRDLGRAGARVAIARAARPDAEPALEISEPTLVIRRTTGPAPR